MPTIVPPISVPAGPLPVPLPLELFGGQETSDRTQEQGQVQLQPAPMDYLPPQVEELLNNDLPPATINEPVCDSTKATVWELNCTRCPSRRLRDSIRSHMVQVYESIFMDNDDPGTNEHPLSAMAASNDPDSLNLNQAMKAQDATKFQKSMAQEFNAHSNMKHWTFVL